MKSRTTVSEETHLSKAMVGFKSLESPIILHFEGIKCKQKIVFIYLK